MILAIIIIMFIYSGIVVIEDPWICHPLVPFVHKQALGQRKAEVGGGGVRGAMLPPLSLRSYFAMNVFLEIHFPAILQGFQNFFDPDTSRVSSEALTNDTVEW